MDPVCPGDPFFLRYHRGRLETGAAGVRGGISFLAVISPTDVRFFSTDRAGFITLELLYDSPLGALPLASPLPEPDRLATVTSSEFYEICIFPPASPVGCSLGTIGTQTFSGGEFNFTAAKIAEPSSAVLMLAGLIVSCLLVLRREHG